MDTPARDQAVDYGLRLFRALFKHAGLVLDPRLVENFIDFTTLAVAERLDSQGEAEEELEALADEEPFGPLQDGRRLR